tara:strand:- start:206 stop:1081 length:876 start_codon:yes stop_codon:yes gene_type:complete
MSLVKFSKYQGLGNDFIVIDSRNEDITTRLFANNKNISKAICDRNFGIGADGVILLLPSNDLGDIEMKIFNSDGSEAEMCGNGIRCLIKFMIDNDNFIAKKKLIVETKAGLISASSTDDNQIRVNMGQPIFDPIRIPTLLTESINGVPSGKLNINNNLLNVYSISMGNPHMVCYFDDISNIDFAGLGPRLEKHSAFPNKTNVHFVQIIDRSSIKVLVWERGCGATMACGTGACAVMVVSYLLELCNQVVQVILTGGNLEISWNGYGEPVYMKGPANKVYEGIFESENYFLE